MKLLCAVTTHWPAYHPSIIRAAWQAAQRSGADIAKILTVGPTNDAGPVNPLPIADDCRVHLGPNRGHQAGERDLVAGAIAEAERLGCDWIVKAAGDCIHTASRWAQAWVEAAKGMEATIIGDRWPELHNWRETGNTTELLRVMPQSKVFAGSVKFLKATWPLTDSGFIERDWELRIKQGGWWALVRLVAADEVDQYGEGSQQVWLPKSGPLRFKHCHSVGELPCGPGLQ